MIGRLHRLPEVGRALRAGRQLAAHEDWSIERLRAHQRKRLLAIVRHAAASSPYYRERFAGIELSEDLDLAALPTLDKPTMLENFDELVTDRRLTLARVEAHLGELERAGPRADPKLLGEYRVVASGGTSGRRGVFVYGLRDWTEALGGAARVSNAYLGMAPRLPRRRLTTIFADSPLHVSGRAMRSVDVGMYRLQRLDARIALDELVEALNRFRPESLNAYPSIAALLAERQLAGELRISPRLVSTSGEVRTTYMEEKMAEAWGRAPFDFYNASESGAPLAAECDRHAGMHLFGDLFQIEVVGDDHQPVAAGEAGSRLLLTNLLNRTQPLIRYELNDLVTVSPAPCPCGRPFPLVESVAGRSDDVLDLPRRAGGTIKVHPLVLHSPLTGIAGLRGYRILYSGGELRVDAVLAAGDEKQAGDEIAVLLDAALTEWGAQAPPIRVASVPDIPRHSRSGKQKAIEIDAG
jgi:phenylacetate-CoA ligase